MELAIDFTHDGLRIFALNARRLRLFLDDRSALFAELGLPDQPFDDPDDLVEMCRSHTIPHQERFPNSWIYYARWLCIEVETGLVVADFMLKQGLDSTGCVDIGYGVNPPFENRGWMTRGIGCFLEWAASHPPIQRVKAETELDNQASIRVLEKNGFRRFVELDESVWWERRV